MIRQPLTSKQRTQEFLNSLGIEFIVDGRYIRIKEGMRNVGGYPDFETTFEFSNDGKFIEIGAYMK